MRPILILPRASKNAVLGPLYAKRGRSLGTIAMRMTVCTRPDVRNRRRGEAVKGEGVLDP